MMDNHTHITGSDDANTLGSNVKGEGDIESVELELPPIHKDENSALLESVFQRIYDTSMADVPICNSALKVEAIAYGVFETEWVGILVTPWCMNIMMLPGNETEGWDQIRTGLKFDHILPAGQYEFITGKDDELGPYRMCSLFSPMFQFGDHSSAMQTAAISLQTLMDPEQQDEPSEQEKEMNMIWRGEYPEEKLPDPEVPNETNSDDVDAVQTVEHSDTPKQPIELSRRDFLRGNKSKSRKETKETNYQCALNETASLKGPAK